MGRGARPGGRASGRDPRRARARRRRGVRRRRADEREGLPAGQVRQSRAGDRQHRLQRPLLHGERRGRGQPVPRHRPRPALPAGRPRRRAGGPPARQQRRRDHAAVRAAPRRCAGRAAGSSWSTRAAARPPSSPRTARGTTSSRCPAPTSSSCSPCCTSSSPRASPTRHTSRSAPPGLEELRRSVAPWWPERAERECGVPATDAARAPPACWPRPARHAAAPAPSSSPAAGWSSPPRGPPTVTAAINLALALGLPGRQGSGYGALTGQGNGQGGREHGQKADQLPGYRMIDDPAARAHVAGVWGVAPESLPGKGLPAVELLRSLGTPTGPRALLVHGSNLVVSAPNAGPSRAAAARPRPPRGLRLRPLRDGPAGRRRAARHPVGRGGGDHDLPRGPGHPATQGRRRHPRASAPSCGSGPSWPAASARPAPSRPTRRTSSTSSPAPAPGAAPTTAASATSASTPRTGSSGPAPPATARPPRDAEALHRRLPHPGRPCPPRPGGPPRPE